MLGVDKEVKKSERERREEERKGIRREIEAETVSAYKPKKSIC
jgi:hypothetical protein